MRYDCPSCNVGVSDSSCICCDKCNKWYHLSCTELKTSDFKIYNTEKSLEWICDNCSQDYCNKCEIIFRHGKSICCDS